ncbi:MAG: energy transducer TonB [Acidobacteria bacterium]|nr:energy transducer TonB [Acidobacteriota bacterium]
MRSHQFTIVRSVCGQFTAAVLSKFSEYRLPDILGSSFNNRFFLLPILFLLFSFSTYSQKIAIVTPDPAPGSESALREINALFSREFDVVPGSMSEMIFAAMKFERPFNLSTEDAVKFGESVGSNYFLLLRTDTLRRTSFEREAYFESYITFFLVSCKTGKLLSWKFYKFEEDSPGASEKKLLDSLGSYVSELTKTIRENNRIGPDDEAAGSKFEIAPEPAGSNDLRPPMPYLRKKPEYTKIAGIYDVLATVDVAVDIDQEGNLKNTEILRWAGYGLDESVLETVRSLRWRPADSGGKPLAMRVLLRYNFKNIDSESELNNR